jgi:hypothetical protein
LRANENNGHGLVITFWPNRAVCNDLF